MLRLCRKLVQDSSQCIAPLPANVLRCRPESTSSWYALSSQQEKKRVGFQSTPRRWLSTSQLADATSIGEGSQMLKNIADNCAQPFRKYTLQDLLELESRSQEERLLILERELNVGISKIIATFQDLPLGFGSLPSIRSVVLDYVHDLRDLSKCSTGSSEEFQSLLQVIFMRHRGMMSQISVGLRDFQEVINTNFPPYADYEESNCADIGDIVPAVQHVEQAMDKFFTVRTTLRLLIAHCIQLNPSDKQDGPLHRAQDNEAESPYVGAICLDTRPSLVLLEAYQHASYLCRRKYGKASVLYVNDIPSVDYYSEASAMETSFPYVDIHMYFVFLEVLKNALQTSARKAGTGEEPPPLHASLMTGSSLVTDNERTIKVTDGGEGIPRDQVKKVWSYFYTTSGQESEESMPLSEPRHLAGRGLGLPVSRVLARYFGGDIDLHSIPRRGTDVYIYL